MKLEPSVKDYALTDAAVLYISVINDGTRRDGLAEYFCSLMNEHNMRVYRVKIVQYGSHKSPQRDNAYGILLGEANCD